MIIDMKKFLFMGAKEDLADFFIRAQDEGFIEFITDKGKKGEFPESVRKLLDTIKILRKQPLKELYKGEGDLYYADEIASQVLDLAHEVEKLSEEKRFLEGEIARVAPFGNFSFDDLQFIEQNSGKTIQFYCVKTSKSHEIEEAERLLYVGTDYDLDYYVGIHDKPRSYPHIIEMHFDKTAEELKNHLSFVDETLRQVEAELKGYAGYIEFLRDALLGQLDIFHLEKAQKEVSLPMEGALFSIEGWVPENKTEKLFSLIEGKAVFFEPIAIEKEDKVPTCMENEKMARLGEDLVKIYEIPSHADKDPSPWVFWAFILFFAIIIADGGYGLLFLSLAFFLKLKFPKLKGSGKRLLKLFFILATSCIVWGILTTSFFGIVIGPKNPLSKLSILNHLAEKKAEYYYQKKDDAYKEAIKRFPQAAKATSGKEILLKASVEKKGTITYPLLDEYTDNILLEISLFIGVVHISLSLLRYLRRNIANIGWIAFAIGGYFFFPAYLNATSMMEALGFITRESARTIGYQLLLGGIGVAFFLALIQKKLKGLAEITHVVQIFADILSYLRLYALALASTLMARTFNAMGANLGLLGGFLVILGGHAINIQLAVMGGVIHGLRLNFIEWYHYSFEGEGRLFNPLRKLRIKQES